MSDADVRKSRCHLNGVLRKNVILSENNKCPPPIFTRNQKKLVVQAWKHVHAHIQEVLIFSSYFGILNLDESLQYQCGIFFFLDGFRRVC